MDRDKYERYILTDVTCYSGYIKIFFIIKAY